MAITGRRRAAAVGAGAIQHLGDIMATNARHPVGSVVVGAAVLALAAESRPVPDYFAPYGLTRTWGPLGLAAAQASYSWAEARDWWRGR